MKIIAINGSPRKKWNTATMLKSAMDGARAAASGADVELLHLYELDYKGCHSCFACKLKGGPSYGRCAVRDGLTPILAKIEKADALLVGSPIYLGAETGEMRSFIERLLFPYYTYTNPPKSLFPKKIRVGLIYTYGATEEMAKERGWDKTSSGGEASFWAIMGEARTVCAFDMVQFDDYSKYEASRFDPAHKARRREEVFPQDCKKAYELGGWVAKQ